MREGAIMKDVVSFQEELCLFCSEGCCSGEGDSSAHEGKVLLW